MNHEKMRTAIIGKYPGSEWAKKVKQMDDDQVVAIFLRLKSSSAFEPQKKPLHIPSTPDHRTAWQCNSCKSTFLADNSQLTECRHCGGKIQVLREEAIKKG